MENEVVPNQTEQDANTIVARMLERNPQLKNHVGREVTLEEFAFAVIVQYKAMTARDPK